MPPSFSIVVDSGIYNTFQQVKDLDQLQQIQGCLATRPEFDRTFSFADFVALLNSVLADDVEADAGEGL